MPITSTGNFLETLDSALATKLSGGLVDANGSPVANVFGETIPIMYGYPEPEFADAEYPTISIYRYSVSKASHRKHNYKEMKHKNWHYTDETKTEIVLVRHPEPYDVFYQVDCLSKDQQTDVKLQEYVIGTLDNYGFLTYYSDYAEENVTVACHLSEMMTLDSFTEEGRRNFRKMYRYRVEGWYEFTGEIVPPVLEIINITHTEWDVVKWTGYHTTSGFAYIVSL